MICSFDEVKKDSFNYANAFCEDNIYLKKFLLNCWNNDIETRSCCSGHNKHNFYVSFINIENNLEYIFSIVNQLYKNDFKITFCYGFDSSENSKKVIKISSSYKNLKKLNSLKFLKSKSLDNNATSLLFKLCFDNKLDTVINGSIEKDTLIFENLLVDRYIINEEETNKKLYFNKQLNDACFKKDNFNYISYFKDKHEVVNMLLFLNYKTNNYNGFFEPTFKKNELEYFNKLLYGEDYVKTKSKKFLH